jgi:hypothetical protein
MPHALLSRTIGVFPSCEAWSALHVETSLSCIQGILATGNSETGGNGTQHEYDHSELIVGLILDEMS